MDHNQDRQTAFRESQARAHVLSKEVRHLREEKSKQVRTVLPLTAGPRPIPSPALTVWTKGPPQPPCHGLVPSFWALEPLQAASTQAWEAASCSDALWLGGQVGGLPLRASLRGSHSPFG